MRGCFRVTLLVAVSAISACRNVAPVGPAKALASKESTGGPATAAWLQSTAPMPPGLDLAAMDLSVDPCEDFYSFSCGGWLKTNEIPVDRPQKGRGLTGMLERNAVVLKAILEAEAEGKLTEAPYAKDVGALYAGCMDEAQHETSLPRVRKEMAALNTRTPAAFAQTLGHLHREGVDAVFQLGSTQDSRDATLVIGQVDQGGLTLPDRDYYLSEAPDRKEVLDALARHLVVSYGLLGQSAAQAKASADTVLKVETQLAKAAQDRVERRDPRNTYHRLDRSGLESAAPHFPWTVYFHAVGAPGARAINVKSPAYVQALGSLFKNISPAEWKVYLGWRYMKAHTLALPKRFQDEDFAFMSKTLYGMQQDFPRWIKCAHFMDSAMGFAVAVPFVQQTFGAEGKAKAVELAQSIEVSFEKNLDTLTWMDAPTRAKALEKVRNINQKIGYPDEVRNYSALKTDRRDFLTSMDHAAAYENARELGQIGKPLDRTEWQITPPIPNAYYSWHQNEVVFPAGILQPPFFDRGATYPVNFGGIGTLMGHEFTHGFDDGGRKYDAHGNLENWWSDASDRSFREKAACVKAQYDGFVSVEGLHVNGALTLGENVADLGGVKLAELAMERWAQSHPKEASAAYRFNARQQFFTGFAQSWCVKSRPEMEKAMVVSDPHAPERFRVNGPLSNLETFREAFSCRQGAKMVRTGPQQCSVW